MIDRLHHIGIVVHDADAALGFYRDVMGLEVAADEVVQEQGVRGVLLTVGENEIELLQPVEPGTGVARYLETRGQTLHHFCFSTDDIRAELARISGLGVELIDQEPRHGLAGEIAFLHPRSMHGVLVELAQPPAGAHHIEAKGFDRVSCRVADYDAAKQRWHEVVGIEERTRFDVAEAQLVIGQLAIGRCLLELIAPAPTPRSRRRSRRRASAPLPPSRSRWRTSTSRSRATARRASSRPRRSRATCPAAAARRSRSRTPSGSACS